MTRQINQAGLELIKDFEGCKLSPYLDSKGIPTIGVGCITYDTGIRVTMDDPAITMAQADNMLRFQLTNHAASVERFVTATVNDNEFAALVSFCYNLGAGSLEHSTLLIKVNASEFVEAADQFLEWNKAGGVEVAGLTRRRQAERSLFLQPMPTEPPVAPQTIDDMLAEAGKDL